MWYCYSSAWGSSAARAFRARTSPARARITVRSACAFALRCFTDTGTADRFATVGPASAHPCGRLSYGFPRSTHVGCMGPRSLPELAQRGLPRAWASAFVIVVVRISRKPLLDVACHRCCVYTFVFVLRKNPRLIFPLTSSWRCGRSVLTRRDDRETSKLV
jgi:hypothetical protein